MKCEGDNLIIRIPSEFLIFMLVNLTVSRFEHTFANLCFVILDTSETTPEFRIEFSWNVFVILEFTIMDTNSTQDFTPSYHFYIGIGHQTVTFMLVVREGQVASYHQDHIFSAMCPVNHGHMEFKSKLMYG